MDLFHVASPRHVAVGDVLQAQVQPDLEAYQQEILRGLFPPDGAVSQWGRSMLADDRMLLGDSAFIEAGLARVPGALSAAPGEPYDETLHVSKAGRAMMRTSRDRVIELALEMMRRTDARFIALPSRLTCVYAYKALDAAEAFYTLQRAQTDCCLWRIEIPTDTVIHEADSRWLAMQRDWLTFMAGALKYWQGRPKDGLGLPQEMETLVPSGAAIVAERLARIVR